MAGCALPPALTDLDLHQYLDGDADPDVIAHLKACPHCLSRAKEIRRLQNQLKHQLFRADCPQPEQFSAYQLHLLDTASSAAIEVHLSHCPYCANELADLTALDAETARTYSGASLQLHNRIRVTVAQWIKNISAGATLPGLQMAALRGSASAPFVFADEERNEISIALVEDQAGRTNHRLTGLVVRSESAPMTGQAMQADIVFVLQAGSRIGSTPVDALGNFEIELPASGDYDLIASLGDVEIHLPTIHVGER